MKHLVRNDHRYSINDDDKDMNSNKEHNFIQTYHIFHQGIENISKYLPQTLKHNEEQVGD